MPIRYYRHKGLSISTNVLGAACDLLIAATLVTLLNFSRTGFQKWSHFSPITFKFHVNDFRIYLDQMPLSTNLYVLSFPILLFLDLLLSWNTFADHVYGEYRLTHQASRYVQYLTDTLLNDPTSSLCALASLISVRTFLSFSYSGVLIDAFADSLRRQNIYLYLILLLPQSSYVLSV